MVEEKELIYRLKELNIKSTFIKGLRVTDKNIVDVVENVLIEFNKEIVNSLKEQILFC